MRVGVDRTKYFIHIPLPAKIDPTVTMMTVEEKPDVTYNDVGGSKEQVEKLREVVELPLLHPEKFVQLGIDPPKGVLCYGPPGTGKTLLARAVANRTDACFIRVIGSELVQKYVGEGARLVRELFQMARSKKACLIFFDEVDAIGGARFDDGQGGDNEVQRTMLEIVNQLDGFDARGNIKVLMATNRPDTLDPALLRPGRLDRKVEFGLPERRSFGFTLVRWRWNVIFGTNCCPAYAPTPRERRSTPCAPKLVCSQSDSGEKQSTKKTSWTPSRKSSRGTRSFRPRRSTCSTTNWVLRV